MNWNVYRRSRFIKTVLFWSIQFYYSGNPPPGTIGGGATPLGFAAGGIVVSPEILATALALVPPGLIAVAVFPPYDPPFRRIDAISVIFAENPNIR